MRQKPGHHKPAQSQSERPRHSSMSQKPKASREVRRPPTSEYAHLFSDKDGKKKGSRRPEKKARFKVFREGQSQHTTPVDDRLLPFEVILNQEMQRRNLNSERAMPKQRQVGKVTQFEEKRGLEAIHVQMDGPVRNPTVGTTKQNW